MDWLENLSVEEQKAWSELMIDHAFDQSEWGDARIELLILLEKDGKKRMNVHCVPILAVSRISGTSQPPPSLSLLVNEFYSAYGMESAAKVEES